VEFAGADITGLAAEEIAKRGLVRTFQLVQLFENLTVLENVKVGRHLHTAGGLLSALLPHRARPIEAGDVVPHKLSLREVIRRFDGDARHFFFLEEGSSIAGLISLANLNSRRARVYLYDLLAELEIRLAKFVGEHVEEARLLGLSLGGESDRLFAASKKRFEADRKKNLESPFVEYLHLWELLQVCKKAGLRQRLGFSSDAFARARIVNDLRARVAHPVRPIVSKLEDGRLVASALEWIEGALGRLPEA